MPPAVISDNTLMHTGISSQMFMGWPFIATHARIVRSGGFDSVELYCSPPHFHFEDRARVTETARVLAGEGVTPISLHCPYNVIKPGTARKVPLSISYPAPADVQFTSDIVKRCIDAAGVLGARTIILHFGTYSDDHHPEALENIVAFLMYFNEYLRGTHIKFALENVATSISKAASIAGVIDRFGFAANMGICLDIGHANINEDPATAIKAAGRHIIHLHLHDNDGVHDLHCIPFESAINWDEVTAALAGLKYDANMVFEPEKTDMEPIAVVTGCAAARQRLFAMIDTSRKQYIQEGCGDS